jgi:hypothetical protein
VENDRLAVEAINQRDVHVRLADDSAKMMSPWTDETDTFDRREDRGGECDLDLVPVRGYDKGCSPDNVGFGGIAA